jgi:hypothetical protein
MPIEIADYPDPLSEGSLSGRGRNTEPLLVESNASRVLRHELERYCRGKINGRSFLIAGHRGAGKTTLVAKAFMDVLRKSADGAAMLRPLFIALHGPSLFPDAVLERDVDTTQTKKEAKPSKNRATREAARKSSDDADTSKDDAPPESEDSKKEPKSEAQIALEQITLGLHRAVSREFAGGFRSRAEDLAWLRRTPRRAEHDLRQTRGSRTTTAPDFDIDDDLPNLADLRRLLSQIPEERELFEMAAQFENELYEGPSPDRLREHWERIHALSGGVLFRGGFAQVASGISGNPTPPTPPGLFPNLPAVNAQGARELVALSGVVEAYRRISGDYKRTEAETSTTQELIEKISGFSAASRDLAAPAVSLLTGGLAGTGLAISGAGAAAIAIGGLATALGSSIVFKMTRTRKSDRSKSREYKFIYDLSVATLDRALPILIERLRNAGLAPVFVVDELDKVTDLSSRIVSMVHHLKKLVAENAFFCFLTNRSYFEEMLAEGSGRAYPVEYTYYTHRLFVVFAPEDFERYLRLRIADPPPFPAGQSASVDTEVSKEATARTMLRWVLRHRAQLHVVDLEREIAALRSDDGTVRTPADEFISALRNRIDLTFQVGIELTLSQPDVEQALMDRPEFRRSFHDAMYFISREWLDGEEEIDTSPRGRERFRLYLERRTGREDDKVKPPTTPNSADANPKPVPKPSFTKRDVDFLFEKVGQLAEYLSDKPSIDVATSTAQDLQSRDWRRKRISDWNEVRRKRGLPDVESDMQDSLLTADRSSLLDTDPQRPGAYRFKHPPAGSARAAAAAAPLQGLTAVEPWAAHADFIDAFAAALDRVVRFDAPIDKLPVQISLAPTGAINLDTLASRFRIISPSPTWSITRKAIDNLREAARRGTQHTTYSEDVFQVKEFYDILSRNAEQIARAIVFGAMVGRSGPAADKVETVTKGMDLIAKAMRFGMKREDEVAKSLENITAMMRVTTRLSFDAHLAKLSSNPPDVTAFVSSVNAALKTVWDAPVPDTLQAVIAAWDNVQLRLTQWVTNGEVVDADLSEIIAAAAQQGPTELVEFDPREMTLQQWTHALLGARKEVGLLPPPKWLTYFAWHSMGFRGEGDFFISELSQWAGVDRPPPGATLESVPAPLARTFALINDRRLLGGPPPQTLVMLRRSRSMTGQWRPSAGTAALLVTAEELEQTVKKANGQPMVLSFGSLNVVGLEMKPEFEAKLTTVQLPQLARLLPNAWFVNVYPGDAGREMQSPNVVDPPSPQSVIDAAQRGGMLMPLPQ